MPHEIEAKFKVASFAAVRRALRAAGAARCCTVMESDRFFDTPGHAMLRGDSTVRLRDTRQVAGPTKVDARPLLTFKGPGRRNTKLKIRKEIQTHVDDSAAVVEILAAAGLTPAFTLLKRREVYHLRAGRGGQCEVLLDELPVIGRFVEIEGPSQSAVLAVAKKLGLDQEPIRTSYARMMMDRHPLGTSR